MALKMGEGSESYASLAMARWVAWAFPCWLLCLWCQRDSISLIDDRSSGSFQRANSRRKSPCGRSVLESRIVREMLTQNPDPVGISEQNQTIGQPFNRGHAIELPGDFWICRIGEVHQLNGLQLRAQARPREKIPKVAAVPATARRLDDSAWPGRVTCETICAWAG